MEGCPVKFALGLVSGKWKLRILWELNQQEVIRFNAFFQSGIDRRAS